MILKRTGQWFHVRDCDGRNKKIETDLQFEFFIFAVNVIIGH